MLDLMRKHARSWFIQVILFAVIIVFVFWGVGSYRESRSNRIAVVNDHAITINEFRQTYEGLIKRYRDMYGDALTENLINKLGLKEMALEGLIERVLLMQEAENLRVEVTKDELKQAIMSYPAFQKNGAFDNSQYLWLLRQNRMTPEEFEQSQRKDLLIRKVQHYIQDSAKISHKEILNTYTLQNESTNIEFFRISSSSFLKQIKPSDEELQQYFSEHEERYRIPVKVNAGYLVFDPKDHESKIKIEENEIEEYYQANISTYTIPEKVKARHIFIESPAGNDPESIEEAREEAEKVLNEIRKGKDFATLAKEYSEDPSAKKGGDLGYIERERLAEPLQEALSSLKKGEVTPVVETPYGFHIMKVEKIKKGRIKPLKEVKAQITSTLKKEKSRDLADEEAEEFYLTIFDEDSLKRVADSSGKELKETGFFASGENIKGIGRNKAVSDAAFFLEKGEISEILKSGDNSYILEVIEKQPSRLPEYDEVKKDVEKEVKNERSRGMASERAEKLLAELRNGKDWKVLVSEHKLTSQETGFFKRNTGTIPKIGYSEDIRESAFSLNEADPYPSKVFEVNGIYFVIRLKSKKGIDKETFQSEKDQFGKMLIEQKREVLLRAWLEDLKAKSEIKREL